MKGAGCPRLLLLTLPSPSSLLSCFLSGICSKMRYCKNYRNHGCSNSTVSTNGRSCLYVLLGHYHAEHWESPSHEDKSETRVSGVRVWDASAHPELHSLLIWLDDIETNYNSNKNLIKPVTTEAHSARTCKISELQGEMYNWGKINQTYIKRQCKKNIFLRYSEVWSLSV